MKLETMKRISILLALLACLSATAQKATLTGTLTGLPEGTLAIVGIANGNSLDVYDTLRLDAKGQFRFTPPLTQPELFILHLDHGSQAMCHLFLEPKDKASVELLYVQDRDMFKLNSCKGSRNIELYRQFNDILLGAVNPTLQQMIPYQVEELLGRNMDVLASAFLVTFFENDLEAHAKLYKDIHATLVKRYPGNDFVKHLGDKVKGILAAGMEAPEIEQPDPQGNTRRLSDLRGKVVLIDFWASWCNPCRRENPNVVRLYQKYHDKGFEIFSVSLDKSKGQWVKAIQDDGLVWPNHVSDLQGWNSAPGQLYGIRSIPATVLIDAEGKVIARNLRGAALEQKLAEILGEK